MQSSSGISQPARACHIRHATFGYTRIGIRIPKTFQHAVSQIAKNGPGSFRIRGHPLGKEVPTSFATRDLTRTLQSRCLFCICGAGACAATTRIAAVPESPLFSYILKALCA